MPNVGTQSHFLADGHVEPLRSIAPTQADGPESVIDKYTVRLDSAAGLDLQNGPTRDRICLGCLGIRGGNPTPDNLSELIGPLGFTAHLDRLT